MTITNNDIKLFQSQDNTDKDSGGGSRTNVEVVDGDVNNLFPDISRIDTVSGDVALRKVFPTVTTVNSDVYYGSHALIRKPPTDDKVSALIFHTDDPYDKRIDAQDKIESYVVASYKEEFWLYGNHVIGAKSVTFLQNIESQTPDVGEVYLLKDGVDEQYIRVAQIDVQEITLIYSDGGSSTSYVRRRVICEIDQALEFAFRGSAFHPSGQLENTANTWATQVADAAKFYATKTLLEDATLGDVVIKVDSIFEQLVPASKKQTPIINQDALVQGSGLIATGNLIKVDVPVNLTIGLVYALPHPIVAGSMTRIGTSSYTDDGLGNIIDGNDTIIGRVNYKEGTIEFTSFGYNSPRVDYEVANVFDSNIQFTGEIKITQENVGNVFVQRLSPLPSSGDLYIDYRSNGKWYRFASSGNRVSGNEAIGGDANIGGGSLNDNTDGTGTVSMTLASLPDIDSSIIISWGSAERLSDRNTFIASETSSALTFDLGQTNINPLSFVMQVMGGGVGGYKNITALADGTLVDDLSAAYKVNGTLDFINGKVFINKSPIRGRFNSYSDTTNPVIIDFDYSSAGIGDNGEIKLKKFSNSPVGDEIAFTAEDTNLGTIRLNLGGAVRREGLNIRIPLLDYGILNLESDAVGVLRKVGRHWEDLTTYGTVSAVGVIDIQFIGYGSRYLVESYATTLGIGSRYTFITKFYTFHGFISVNFQGELPTTYSLSHNITGHYKDLSKFEIQTLPNIAGEVGLQYPRMTADIYSKDGLMYESNGAQIGVINYQTGEIEMSCYMEPDPLELGIRKLFTDDLGEDDLKMPSFTFRTSATKLTTSSFQLHYETANGVYIATSDGNGVLTGVDINIGESYVDTKTGMANIVFTEPVIVTSLKYDAVAESSLPLDPELLGLNPVRLPSDGRVPVFKSGYHIIIFNEVTTATTNPTPLANDVETLARSGQAYIEVIDVNGKRLDPVQYVADRAAGTVTFSGTLVLEDKYNVALTAPFYVVDRVEDMLLATDVQINGLISLSAGLSRNYTSGVTNVASSLVWGDTGARVYGLFTQEIWNAGNPVWSDTLIGDDTTAKYDDVNNVIRIDNQSSSAGRWAIIFKSSTTVDVVHEKLGVVDAGVAITVDDVAPINPSTGAPYFTMPKQGFGSGWVTNNVIRLNTDSGDNNMWVIRTVQSGALSELTDSIDLEIRGDAN